MLLLLHLFRKPLYPFYNDTLLTTGKTHLHSGGVGNDVLITACNNESSYFPFRLLCIVCVLRLALVRHVVV
jgi:hypothetical protein